MFSFVLLKGSNYWTTVPDAICSYVFLTGSPNQVQAMAKKYRVYVSKADEAPDGDYLVDHSIVIYFHDDTGDLADCFTQSMRPSDIIEKIVERVNFVPSY